MIEGFVKLFQDYPLQRTFSSKCCQHHAFNYKTRQDMLLLCINLLAKEILDFQSGSESMLSNTICSKFQLTVILGDFNAT